MPVNQIAANENNKAVNPGPKSIEPHAKIGVIFLIRFLRR